MKEVSNKEIRDIAENIVTKTSESSSDHDVIEDISSMLREIFEKMKIVVEKLKNKPDCKCTDCKCK